MGVNLPGPLRLTIAVVAQKGKVPFDLPESDERARDMKR